MSSFRIGGITEHVIGSGLVAQKFKLRVFTPIRRVDGSERFPVLYATDGDEFFAGLSNVANELQLAGEAPRFIVVGIGYEDARAADLLRMRDFFTHAIRTHFQPIIEQLASSELENGVEDLAIIT